MTACQLRTEYRRCCCNCRHLAEDHSHPCTDGRPINERAGFACLAPEFVEPRSTKFGLRTHVRIVFSKWSEHGICEMHEERITDRERASRQLAADAFGEIEG